MPNKFKLVWIEDNFNFNASNYVDVNANNLLPSVVIYT